MTPLRTFRRSPHLTSRWSGAPTARSFSIASGTRRVGAVDHGRAARAGGAASGSAAGRPARCRRSLDHAHLRRGGAESGCARANVHRARARPREAGDDPVWQLARASAGQPRRVRRRRSGHADQRRLFADERRPCADQGDRRADRTRARVRRRRRGVRRRRSTPSRRRSRTPSSPGAIAKAHCDSTPCCTRPAATPPSRIRRRTRSPSCSSPRARPGSRRASSTPTGCCARTRRCSRQTGRSCPTSPGPGRLAALESHVRGQSQPEPGAVQRRHDLHRRRRTGRRRCSRGRSRRCTTSRRRCTSTCRRGTRCSRPPSRTTRRSPSGSSAA